MVFIENHAALIRTTQQVRDNLIEQGYHRTVVEILSQMIVGQRSVRVSLRWRHLTRTGELMNNVEGQYYCTKHESLGWRVSIIEFERATRDRLTKGLALA